MAEVVTEWGVVKFTECELEWGRMLVPADVFKRGQNVSMYVPMRVYLGDDGDPRCGESPVNKVGGGWAAAEPRVFLPPFNRGLNQPPPPLPLKTKRHWNDQT